MKSVSTKRRCNVLNFTFFLNSGMEISGLGFRELGATKMSEVREEF